MSESINRLRHIVETETAHFCETEQALQVGKGTLGRAHDNPETHARLTNCGKATALVQHNLHKHHDTATQRLFGEPPLAPRIRHTNRKFGHVLLRTDEALIDPTYGQLFSYVGLHAPVSYDDFSYPNPLSLTIDLSNPAETLDPLIDSLDEASRRESAQLDNYGPLRGQGRQAIRAVIYDIYNPDNYVPYEVETIHPSFDYIQALKQISAATR